MFVDAAGNCTTCGTYRAAPAYGAPAYGSPTPTSGPPQQPSAPPYPASTPPYPGSAPPYPGSAPPYPASPQPYQASAVPYPAGPQPYQASAAAGAWPAYGATVPVPAAPARTRSPMFIPLIALSAVLLVITASIVFITVLRSGSGRQQVTPGTSATGQPGSSPSASSLIDSCVVGAWTETSHQEDVAVEGVGTVRFTGKGAVQRFGPDGVAVLDYGSGVKLIGSSGSTTWEYTYTGTVNFHYQTSNGNILYSDTSANGRTTLRVNGKVQSDGPIEAGSLDPERYTCSGDSLREFTGHYSIELSRNG
jgi:hypothetical protein